MTGLSLLNQLTGSLAKVGVIYSNLWFFVLGLYMLFLQVRPRIAIDKSIKQIPWQPSQAIDFRDLPTLSHRRFIQNIIQTRSRTTSAAISHTRKCHETKGVS